MFLILLFQLDLSNQISPHHLNLIDLIEDR